MVKNVRRPAGDPAGADSAKTVLRDAHAVRIIGGMWKRSKLPVGNSPGLRPTPDRVRETLFNWLGQDLRGWRCIDVFAGTGALGFEAASRGASEVLLVEQDRALVEQLQAQRLRLEAGAVTVLRGDAVLVLRQQAVASVDLVFLDPPFDSLLYDAAVQAAVAAMAPDGYLYLEAARPWSAQRVAGHGLVLQRQLKAGAVVAHLLKKQSAPHA
ncbi:MAG: 16S rRNA (guanine(966)-N(2))-methyltransferase RsmD [Rhodoferax sp.]|nr:16S rRNA (guanine(966)-N(2))-methyltransferase RsmD [Rhodoferax sp.]